MKTPQRKYNDFETTVFLLWLYGTFENRNRITNVATLPHPHNIVDKVIKHELPKN